jgi:hypothetical protein
VAHRPATAESVRRARSRSPTASASAVSAWTVWTHVPMASTSAPGRRSDRGGLSEVAGAQDAGDNAAFGVVLQTVDAAEYSVGGGQQHRTPCAAEHLDAAAVPCWSSCSLPRSEVRWSAIRPSGDWT